MLRGEMNEEQFEALLYEEESPTLDFKRDQYPFQGEAPDVKSELLKDILAFANSWRRSDAYILVGVEEVKGGRSRVVGVQAHLNDNDLQQFVNSKTQRPVEFSYTAFAYHGRQIGIIHVPVQERPLYITRDFGRLLREAVYIRRGSSTAEADPDEIARMGAAAPLASEAPRLKLEVAAPEERSLLGETTVLETVVFSVPPDNEIPDYRSQTGISLGTNRNFYRELAAYLCDFYRVQPLRLAVTNIGNTTAHDVRLEAHVSESTIHVLDEYDLPKKPVHETAFAVANLNVPFNRDVDIERVRDGWRFVAEFGKRQPKQTVFTNSRLYLGAPSSCEAALRSRVFADELPHPIESRLVVHISVDERELSVDKLLEF